MMHHRNPVRTPYAVVDARGERVSTHTTRGAAEASAARFTRRTGVPTTVVQSVGGYFRRNPRRAALTWRRAGESPWGDPQYGADLGRGRTGVVFKQASGGWFAGVTTRGPKGTHAQGLETAAPSMKAAKAAVREWWAARTKPWEVEGRGAKKNPRRNPRRSTSDGLTKDQRYMLRVWHSTRTDPHTFDEVDTRLRLDDIDPNDWKVEARKLVRVRRRSRR